MRRSNTTDRRDSETRHARNRTLIAAAQAGDQRAMDTLLRENEPLVYRWASRYMQNCTGNELADLQQAGRIGLWEAINTYDLKRDIRFSTHASWRIRGRIGSLLRHDRLIHIPSHVLESRNGNEPSDLPVCLTSLDDIAAIPARSGMMSRPATVGELLVSGNDTEAEALAGLIDEDSRSELQCAINSLCHAEWQSLILRYGLDDGISRTLDEVGKLIGVSKEAVRGRVERAIRHLRRALGVTL